ncbi:MAG: site-specific DNA-methyltransferase [Gammaproteobacteria bacterium]|jgi:DNA modification methylase|nr:site-specific DNA-methyltransferase [Gammaproteobacteria bacterium]
MSPDEFAEFLFDALLQLERACTNNALLYVFMDWRHQFELLMAREKLMIPLINMCVWVKNNGGMGSFYRSQHELVYVFKHGDGLFINNVELGKHGRYRTNVWNYPGVNSFGEGRDEALAMHPTVKPVAMIADAILDATNRGDIVLDGFLGSGTTLLAAEQTGRTCYGVEIDPRYVDVAVRRWEEATGNTAIHEQSSVAFEDVTIRRPDPTMREL